MGRWLLSPLLLTPLAALLQPFVPVDALTGEDGGRMWVWGASYAVASVVAIRDALAMRRRRDLDGLRRAGRFVKLASIPFFIGNVILLGAFAAGTAFMGIGLVLAPFFVAGTYLAHEAKQVLLDAGGRSG